MRTTTSIRNIIDLTLKHGWILVLAVTMTFNVLLVQELRRRPPVPQPMPTVEVGAILPDITLSSYPSRSPVAVSYAKGRTGTILYYMSPGCGWCWRNEPNIEALLTCVRDKYNFWAISAAFDGLNGYFGQQQPRYPLLVDDLGELREATNVSGTPTTIVVDNSGKVLEAWTGAYLNRTADLVSSYFDCSLPGLRDPIAGLN